LTKKTCYTNFNNLNNYYISISIFLNDSKNENLTNQFLIKNNFQHKKKNDNFLLKFEHSFLNWIFNSLYWNNIQNKFFFEKKIIFLVLNQIGIYKFLFNYGNFEMVHFSKMNLLLLLILFYYEILFHTLILIFFNVLHIINIIFNDFWTSMNMKKSSTMIFGSKNYLILKSKFDFQGQLLGVRFCYISIRFSNLSLVR